jgi:hypothetical protein
MTSKQKVKWEGINSHRRRLIVPWGGWIYEYIEDVAHDLSESGRGFDSGTVRDMLSYLKISGTNYEGRTKL